MEDKNEIIEENVFPNKLNRAQRRKLMNKVLLKDGRIVNKRKIKHNKEIKEEYVDLINNTYNSAKEYIKRYLQGYKEIVLIDENNENIVISGKDLRKYYHDMVKIVHSIDVLKGNKKLVKFNGGKSHNKNIKKINMDVNDELGEENGK